MKRRQEEEEEEGQKGVVKGKKENDKIWVKTTYGLHHNNKSTVSCETYVHLE